MIKNILSNKLRNPDSLKKICWGHSKGCSLYRFVSHVISEKTLCGKGCISNLRDIFYMKTTVTVIPTGSVPNSFFILFLSFCRNHKEESDFQQVGGQIFVFCLLWVLLNFKGMSNSIDVSKGIFLHGFFRLYCNFIPLKSLGFLLSLAFPQQIFSKKARNKNIKLSYFWKLQIENESFRVDIRWPSKVQFIPLFSFFNCSYSNQFHCIWNKTLFECLKFQLSFFIFK